MEKANSKMYRPAAEVEKSAESHFLKDSYKEGMMFDQKTGEE